VKAAGEGEDGNAAARRDLAEVAEHSETDFYLFGGWSVEGVHEQDEDGVVVRSGGGEVGVNIGRELDWMCGRGSRRRGLMLFKEGDLLGGAVLENLELSSGESFDGLAVFV